MSYPGYLQLYKTGELFTRIEKGKALLQECRICPRRCKVNRLEDKPGVCKIGRLIKVSSYDPHFGEEAPLDRNARLRNHLYYILQSGMCILSKLRYQPPW